MTTQRDGSPIEGQLQRGDVKRLAIWGLLLIPVFLVASLATRSCGSTGDPCNGLDGQTLSDCLTEHGR